VLGFAHDYDEISQAPAVPGRLNAGIEVGRQYTRAARSANSLRNFIREQGWPAESFPGPRADALLMIPAAIAAGLGELGKHGSIINRTHGASFRLAAVSTDLPLLADEPDVFGADDFCHNCRICTDACPPEAIAEQKQLVRGDEKWYVDFDRCIPYFAETKGCAICIARCPWSRPGIADNLLVKMARRRERRALLRKRRRDRGAVGAAARRAQPEGLAHSEHDRRHDCGRLVELNVGEVDVVTRRGYAFSGEQAPHGDSGLLERTDGLARQRADLIHPRRHAVPETCNEPAGMESRQRRDLHRGRSRVSEDRRHDPETDGQPPCRRECGRARRDPTGQEAVFPEPELVKAGSLGCGRE
jgi:Pyruvate/2-oxoacid:ferredoxin oxidoreductase delta subunit